MPPMMLRIKIDQPEQQLSLWLPLFIIVPLFLIITLLLMIIMLPLILIGVVFIRRFWWFRPLMLLLPVTMACMCASRGLKLDFDKGDERVFISLI